MLGILECWVADRTYCRDWEGQLQRMCSDIQKNLVARVAGNLRDMITSLWCCSVKLLLVDTSAPSQVHVSGVAVVG